MNNSPPIIYLAGPIFGCTEGEAKDWRAYVTERLYPFSIRTISPLRCEPLIGERYDVAYADPCFGMPKAILAKNFLDLQRCDMTLAFFPPVEEPAQLQEIARRVTTHAPAMPGADVETLYRIAAKGPQRSVGTIGEVSWAYALRKPCVLVTQDAFIKSHPFTQCQPDWPILDTLDDAVRLIKGLYQDYAR